MTESKTNLNNLWDRYFRDKTLDIKNELIVSYVYLVEKTVIRMMPTYEGYSSFDDMVSSGVLGLMDAIDKYDRRRNVKFEHYAILRIKGEIIDQIRKQDWAPSSLRRKIKSISNAYIELESKLYRAPTDREVAEHLDMQVDGLHKIVQKAHTFNIIHFEEMVSQDSSVFTNIPSNNVSVEQEVLKKEMAEILGNMIDSLPEREKLVVSLYYYEEMTLKEIADIIGVTESRISQIHSKVIMKLRTKMKYINK